MVLRILAIQIVTLVLLQKLAIPLGEDRVQLSLPVFYLCFAVLAWHGRLTFNLQRAGLYMLFAVLAILSNVISQSDLSSKSLMLVLVLYAPYMLMLKVTRATYVRVFNFFSGLMAFVAGLEILEHVVQITMGAQNWPSMDAMLPQQILVPQFVYLQPLKFGSALMKPNAFFFLEVSLLAQFLGLALVAEVLFFKRVWRIVLFAATILFSFSGTGLVLVFLCAPLLITRFTRRTLFIAAGAGLVAVTVALGSGWWDLVSHRMNEYQHAGSSSNQRFVAPVDTISNVMQAHNILFSGTGAGTIPNTLNFAWWPIAKLMVEYGLLTTVAFFAFLGVCTLLKAPNIRLSIAVLIFYNFLGGGFATPVYALAPLLFCALMWVAPDESPRPRAERRRLRDPSRPAAAFEVIQT